MKKKLEADSLGEFEKFNAIDDRVILDDVEVVGLGGPNDADSFIKRFPHFDSLPSAGNNIFSLLDKTSIAWFQFKGRLASLNFNQKIPPEFTELCHYLIHLRDAMENNPDVLQEIENRAQRRIEWIAFG